MARPFLAQREGFAPLAARPAPPLSMVSFAFMQTNTLLSQGKALTPVRGSPLESLFNSVITTQKKGYPQVSFFCVAQREGFEPPETLVSTVFKTAAIDHSTISASILLYFPQDKMSNIFARHLKKVSKNTFSL